MSRFWAQGKVVRARHERAGRRHRKQSVQPSGEYDDDDDDDDLQVGAAFHAQMLAA